MGLFSFSISSSVWVIFVHFGGFVHFIAWHVIVHFLVILCSPVRSVSCL